jgi:hypothetical protein
VPEYLIIFVLPGLAPTVEGHTVIITPPKHICDLDMGRMLHKEDTELLSYSSVQGVDHMEFCGVL